MPQKHYHRNSVFNMAVTGKFLWTVDCDGYLNRLSFE